LKSREKGRGTNSRNFEDMLLSRDRSDQKEDSAHNASPGYVVWLSRKI